MVYVDEFGNFVKFSGLSAEAFQFFKRLKRNNRREWFKPRKEEYEALLQKPLIALLQEVGDGLRQYEPSLRVNPKKSVMRIYRDIRFSANKTPYKTHIAANFSLAPKHDPAIESSGFYLHVAPGDIFVAGGLYQPSSKQLNRIRQALDENPAALLKIIRGKTFKSTFKQLEGNKLKRGPKGFLLDHPHLEPLKMKQFYVLAHFTEREARQPAFAKKVTEKFAKMIPLMKWLDATANPRGF